MINRGIDRQGIYRNDRDCEHFVKLLGEMSARYGVEVHAYVLMGNHYHLVVRVMDGNLSGAMQWLNVSYSVWSNRRHGRVGPVFQGRFKSVPVEGGVWLYALSQYLHLNPVRMKWVGLDKRGRRAEGLGLRKVENAEEAVLYYDKIKKAAPAEISWLQPSKYSFLVISEENLQLLKTNKDIEVYKVLLNNQYPGKF